MGRRLAKNRWFPWLLSRNISRSRRLRVPPLRLLPVQLQTPGTRDNGGAEAAGEGVSRGVGKKKTGVKAWIRLDRAGNSEVLELDKSAILERTRVTARDLKILGPVFSNSAHIIARENAMVVNLENIRAIVTADEMLLLNPFSQEVVLLVDQLRLQLPLKNVHINGPAYDIQGKDYSSISTPILQLNDTGNEQDLPFEFQVLEVVLEVVCSSLDSSVVDLERNAFPVLDELSKKVSTKILERVRSLKSNITRLFARAQKVRDEIGHLLDDNEDMANLHLTRKQILNQQAEALMDSGSTVLLGANTIHHSDSVGTNKNLNYDVEDLEMLLEAYFMQLDGIRNRILRIREYVDDTEDYLNIRLDNQRNEIIQFQLTITMFSFAVAVDTFIAGAFAMNLPCQFYNIDGMFFPFVAATSAFSLLLFFLLWGYARWKKLLGS